MTNRESVALFALIAASGTIGFVAGLMAAPRSGRETRRRLGRRIDEEREDLLHRGRVAARRMGDKLDDGIEEGRRVVAQALGH